MDIRELIDTLNNVVDKEAEVMVTVGDTFTGISHITIGSGGILVHLDAGEVVPSTGPQPDPRIGTTVNDWHGLNLLPAGTEVRDSDGDFWLKYEEGCWTWYKYSDGTVRLEPVNYYDNQPLLEADLPVTITKIEGN